MGRLLNKKTTVFILSDCISYDYIENLTKLYLSENYLILIGGLEYISAKSRFRILKICN